jgi:uncharacterized cupredoxin-like copper-binding protein
VFRRTNVKLSFSLLLAVMMLVVLSVAPSVQSVGPVHFVDKTVSNVWVDFYGTTFTVQGAPAEVGDEIAVFDPDGVLCGGCVVHLQGTYGFLHVYGDDPTTLDVDEGASVGDVLTFVAWDASEKREISCAATAITGPQPPQWTNDGDLWNVNLSALAVPEDVSGLISESRSEMHVDRVTGVATIMITITNFSGGDLVSPMMAVITNISSADVAVANADGVTPEGEPSFDLDDELGDGALSPGESVAFTVQFNNPNRVRFTFEVKVLAVRY